MAIAEYDVLLVGAGFGSICMLHRLRKQGFNIRIFEKGAGSGGIWYWNCYPGARVDSDAPIYQLFEKEVYEDFKFKERYPGGPELRRYFDYLDKKLDVNSHVDFNKAVTGATFNEERRQWLVECEDGTKAWARWFIPSIGFAAKPYVPPYKNMDKFKGEIHHTAYWPQSGVDMKRKRVAVIGTGASGVQTIQEVGKDAQQLTVYQRTPNYALPMNQKKVDDEKVAEQKKSGYYEDTFKHVYTTFAGFTYDFEPKNTFDVSPEEREKFYHHLLVEEGGFMFWLANYQDTYKDEKANMEAYKFWKNYVRSRLRDSRKAAILAPENPPHGFGLKRPSLEQYYYEIYNLAHVDLIDVGADPIAEFTEKGIRTESGHEQEFDVIALATGFDSVTGSLAQLDIRGTTGKSIADHWKDGLRTAIGMALNEFPNMFFLYGPQAPTAFSNGPSCVQLQARWLDGVMADLVKNNITRFEAKRETEDEWTKRTHAEWDATLFPKAKSWYQGANIPGRKVEPLNWAGGIPAYIKALDDSMENGYQGWIATKAGEEAPKHGKSVEVYEHPSKVEDGQDAADKLKGLNLQSAG